MTIENIKDEWLSALTEEQKERVRACKDEKELVALVSELGMELPDEALEAVSGGGCGGPKAVRTVLRKGHLT